MLYFPFSETTPSISNEDAGTQAFFEAMRAFRATWLWHPLPRPYEGTRAVLLPRSEARSMRVADELRSAGIADLGAHLAALCARQQQARRPGNAFALPSGHSPRRFHHADRT
ncbi:DUF6685 family protein [Verminephrobacter eiseniae]|uniref:DUF6685 family protein n=1 Tax=Verminephrobacter eiseniae TaxID=364317 RepID=UPI0038B31E62